MSSHHFVREGQEPALFVLEAAEFSVAEPLLEWAPLVVVSEIAVERVLLWGIKIDVVLQQKRSESELGELLQNQFPITITPALNEIVSSGMEFIEKSGHAAVNLIARPSDNLFRSIELSADLQVNVFWENQKWSYVTSGIYEKWLEFGQTLDIKPKASAGLSVHGLENAEKSTWRATRSGLITIKSDKSLWICEQVLGA